MFRHDFASCVNIAIVTNEITFLCSALEKIYASHQPVSARSEQSDIKCRRNGFLFIGAAMFVKPDCLFHCHSQIIRILKLKIRKLYSLISTLHDLKGLSMQKEMEFHKPNI